MLKINNRGQILKRRQTDYKCSPNIIECWVKLLSEIYYLISDGYISSRHESFIKEYISTMSEADLIVECQPILDNSLRCIQDFYLLHLSLSNSRSIRDKKKELLINMRRRYGARENRAYDRFEKDNLSMSEKRLFVLERIYNTCYSQFEMIINRLTQVRLIKDFNLYDGNILIDSFDILKQNNYNVLRLIAKKAFQGSRYAKKLENLFKEISRSMSEIVHSDDPEVINRYYESCS